MTELPVSVSVPEDGAAGMDGVAEAEADEAEALAAEVEAAGALDEELDELEHAAASNAIGTTAAAVQTKRILLTTNGYSFTETTLKRGVAISHAGAGEQRTALRSRAAMNARLRPAGGRNALLSPKGPASFWVLC